MTAIDNTPLKDRVMAVDFARLLPEMREQFAELAVETFPNDVAVKRYVATQLGERPDSRKMRGIVKSAGKQNKRGVPRRDILIQLLDRHEAGMISGPTHQPDINLRLRPVPEKPSANPDIVASPQFVEMIDNDTGTSPKIDETLGETSDAVKAPQSEEREQPLSETATDEPASSDGEEPQPALIPLPDGQSRPSFHVSWEWLSVEGREKKLQPGLYFCDDDEDKRVSAPIVITGIAKNLDNGLAVVTVEFIDPLDNQRREVSFNRADLTLDFGKGVIKALAEANFDEIFLKDKLLAYLKQVNVKVDSVCSRTGWTDDRTAFVLGDSVIGNSSIRYAGDQVVDTAPGGTLTGWQRDVSKPLIGNPMSILALSASFAGALLEPLQINGVGIHLQGETSMGKSSTQEAAASIWGHGERFTASWNATESAVEGLAVSRNGMCLSMDEIGEADAGRVGKDIYKIANGRGKARAGVDVTSGNVQTWRVALISTGELSLSKIMKAAGKDVQSGQNARLININAERTKHGAWDDTHGITGAQMSDRITLAARTHYGHAGRLFVEHLISADHELACRLERLSALIVGGRTEGIYNRVGKQFAVIALAGEIATEADITGWPVGCATECAVLLFNEWVEAQPPSEPDGESVARLVASYVDENRDDLLIRSSASADEFKQAGIMIETKSDDILDVFVRGDALSDIADMPAQWAAKKLDDAGLLAGKTHGKQHQFRQKGELTKAYKVDWKRIRPLIDP